MNNEKVKSILKAILYPLIYLGNWFKYLDKKVTIDFYEVWVGQRCSLRCKECCHLIPYAESVLYDIDAVIADCDAFLEICSIDYISIVGGEPFCHPELYRLIDFLANREDVLDGKLVTNGTVIPDSRTMDSLRALKGKMEVSIDLYPGKENATAQFHDLLVDAGIRCRLTHYNDWSWKRLGGPEQERLSAKAAKAAFSRCWDKQCYTLSNGEFTTCPRGILSEHVFGIPKRKYEHMHLSDFTGRTASKAMIATCMSHKVYKDYCKHCLGMSNANQEQITPGVQIQ